MSDWVQSLDIRASEITSKTSWVFLTLETRSGIVGLGEATLFGRERDVVDRARSVSRFLLGEPIDNPDDLQSALPFDDITQAALSSAVMQAVWDCYARATKNTLSEALGNQDHNEIPLYVNINRHTHDRSPEGFTEHADVAIAEGYSAIKIAPFDELNPDQNATIARNCFQLGIDRIEAVRSRINPDTRLMVDCHWRFPISEAPEFIRELAQHNLYWIECPVLESSETLDLLKHLRAIANQNGVKLAGCENAILCEGFQPFLEVGCYDVMMPDIKYCGGPAEMQRIANLFKLSGVAFSPHNPTGPVAHAASLQTCAIVSNIDMLEYQFDETPLFYKVVGGKFDGIENGVAQVPSAPGLGISFNQKEIDLLPVIASWQEELR